MKKLIFLLFLLTFFTTFVVRAQNDDETTYTDEAKRYQVSIPAGWENRSTGDMGHFVNGDETAQLYSFAIEAEDVQTGMTSALTRIIEGFDAVAAQTTDIQLPGGTVWVQNVYMQADGNLIVALGRVVDGYTYIIVMIASQSALMAETPVLNKVLLEHTLIGETSAAAQVAEYVNPQAFSEQELILVSGEYELPATLSLPVGEGPFPAVVIVHGSGATDRDGSLGLNKPYRDIAQGLASQGIAVLRYDKRAFVYRQQQDNLTIDAEVTDDAVAALQLLRGMDMIDAEQVYVLGHSLGAILSPRVAEKDGQTAGVIVLAGSPRPFDVTIAEQIEYLRELDANANLGGLDALMMIFEAIRNGADPVEAFGGDADQAGYWVSLLNYDGAATAQALDVPMFVLHGGRDYQSTMNDFNAWKEVLADRDDVQFTLYPTLNHIFMALGDLDRMSTAADYNEIGFVDAQVISDIVSWIK